MSAGGEDDSDAKTPQTGCPEERTQDSWPRERDEPSIGEASRARGAILSALFPGDARVLDGRYELGSMIGSGGLGRVYKALDTKLGRHVAVKFLKGATRDPELAQALEGEARVLARLQHPNIVAVHDVGRSEDELYLTMELIDGESLEAWLATRRSWQAVLDVMRQAALGLAAAHEAGVVHRDFKPANVMVDRTGRVRVVDFGLAREVVWKPEALNSTDGVTLQTKAAGTPPYMAPEQFDGEVSAASDQFSFCTTLYEGLCGQRPWKGRERGIRTPGEKASAEATLAQANIPRWLRGPILRGLSSEPGARFSSMDAIGGRLERPTRRATTWILAASSLLVGMGTMTAIGGADPCEGTAGTRSLDEVIEKVPRIRFEELGLGGEFDVFAREWTKLEQSSCRARRAGGVADELLDARERCLDRLGQQLDYTFSVLPKDGSPQDGRAAVLPLMTLHSCEDDSRLIIRASEAGFDAEGEDSILRELGQASALESVGREEEALEVLRHSLAASEHVAGASFARGRLGLLYATFMGRRGHVDVAKDLLVEHLLLVDGEPSSVVVAAELRAMLAFFLSLNAEDAAEAARLARLAETVLERKTDQIPARVIAALAQARADASLKRPEAARRGIERVRALIASFDPLTDELRVWAAHERGRPELEVAIAEVFLVNGDIDLARDAYRTVVPKLRDREGLERALAVALNNLGELEGRQDETRRPAVLVEEAAALKAALGDRRGAAESWMTVGTLHARSSRGAEALQAYDTALGLVPPSASITKVELLYNRGLAHQSSGELQRARADYEAALDISSRVANSDPELLFSIQLAAAQTGLRQQDLKFATARHDAARLAKRPEFGDYALAELAIVGCQLADEKGAGVELGREAVRLAAAGGHDALGAEASACFKGWGE